MHFLITAGGTREYIDPVRFISNASSGRMGYAIADAAIKAGHRVTLISANVSLAPPPKAKMVYVQTSDDMFRAVKKFFPKADGLIMAAAVSDYAPDKISKSKIKKTGKSILIKLRPTTDILKWAGEHKRKHQILVGFALEDKRLRLRAEKKLKEKNLDMIVANAPSAIGAQKTTVQIKKAAEDWIVLKNQTKAQIAKQIINLTERIQD